MSAADGPTSGTRARVPVSGVGLIMVCQSTQGIITGGFALFLPLIRTSLHLSFAAAGAISSASILVYACMQLPSGYLADRFGPRRLFIAGLLGTNVLAFSFAHVDSFGSALANQAAAGFFRALVFAPGLLLMTALFTPDRRATAMGLYIAGGFSSSIFVNTFGPILIGPLGWRALFMIFSGLGLAILAIFARWGPPAPARPAHAHLSLRAGLTLFRTRTMWLIAGVQYIRLAVVTGITLWLPTYVVVERHRSLQLAGLLVALGAIITAPANFLGGYISDRTQNPIAVIGGSLLALSGTTFLIAHVNGLVPLFAAVLVNAFFLQFYFGPLFALPIDLLGPQTAGLASGFSNLFANLGGLTFAYTLGAVRDATGSFDLGFYGLSALSLVGFGLVIALSRTSSSIRAAPETA